MYLQNKAKVVVQYHVSFNLETMSIGVFVFYVEGQAGILRVCVCVLFGV
jgi:hypothetical protein